LKREDINWYGKVILAPMAGVTDRAFRRIAREHGADVVFTEMISAQAVGHKHRVTLSMMDGIEDEHPVIVQLMGSRPEVLARAAVVAEERGADAIDINMGCPVRKIVGSDAGAALTRDPERVAAILREVRKTIEVPLTIKIRTGWDPENRNALEIGRIAEEEGAEAITIHPRTRDQGYGGSADWSVIAELVSDLTIPVIGNGDIKSPEDAERMYRETRCASIMIGRACLGYPWILGMIKNHLAGQGFRLPTTKERLDVARRHIELSVAMSGYPRGLLEMRNVLGLYFRGLTGVREALDQINRTVDLDKVLGVLDELESQNS
jgi:nifR3 family TIM-barrel protein